MLVLFNVVPLVIYLCCWPRLVERFGTTDWGRIFVMAAAAFGTFLTTFAVAINNHLPAAVCAAAAVYAVVRDLVRRRAAAAVFRRRRAVRRAGGGQRVSGGVAAGGRRRWPALEGAAFDAPGLHAGRGWSWPSRFSAPTGSPITA